METWNNDTNVKIWICKVENKNELIMKREENWKDSFVFRFGFLDRDKEL